MKPVLNLGISGFLASRDAHPPTNPHSLIKSTMFDLRFLGERAPKRRNPTLFPQESKIENCRFELAVRVGGGESKDPRNNRRMV